MRVAAVTRKDNRPRGTYRGRRETEGERTRTTTQGGKKDTYRLCVRRRDVFFLLHHLFKNSNKSVQQLFLFFNRVLCVVAVVIVAIAIVVIAILQHKRKRKRTVLSKKQTKKVNGRERGSSSKE